MVCTVQIFLFDHSLSSSKAYGRNFMMAKTKQTSQASHTKTTTSEMTAATMVAMTTVTQFTSTASSTIPSTSGTSDQPISTVQKPSTRSTMAGSLAVQYEQLLNQVLHDFEMLLLMTDGKNELAPMLVYSVFDVICSRGLEIEKGNPEIVINSIQDQKMTELVAYKKGTIVTTEQASDSA